MHTLIKRNKQNVQEKKKRKDINKKKIFFLAQKNDINNIKFLKKRLSRNY